MVKQISRLVSVGMTLGATFFVASPAAAETLTDSVCVPFGDNYLLLPASPEWLDVDYFVDGERIVFEFGWSFVDWPPRELRVTYWDDSDCSVTRIEDDANQGLVEPTVLCKSPRFYGEYFLAEFGEATAGRLGDTELFGSTIHGGLQATFFPVGFEEDPALTGQGWVVLTVVDESVFDPSFTWTSELVEQACDRSVPENDGSNLGYEFYFNPTESSALPNTL